jgi:hypothetical protein
LIDDKLQPTIRNIKKSHERFLQGILACDVFPGLDKCDPLQSQEEDVIPDKYGPKWYEFEQQTENDDANSDGLSNQLAETEPEQVTEENNLLFK